MGMFAAIPARLNPRSLDHGLSVFLQFFPRANWLVRIRYCGQTIYANTFNLDPDSLFAIIRQFSEDRQSWLIRELLKDTEQERDGASFLPSVYPQQS